MIPDRLTKMFARKLIFRTACGPIRSKYTQLLFVWVLRRTACSFLCNFSSFEVMESVQTNNNFSPVCTQLRDRSLALFHACAKVLHSLNNRVLKQQYLMPYHSCPCVIFLTGFPLIRCEPKQTLKNH